MNTNNITVMPLLKIVFTSQHEVEKVVVIIIIIIIIIIVMPDKTSKAAYLTAVEFPAVTTSTEPSPRNSKNTHA
jgi:hypothetical protein